MQVLNSSERGVFFNFQGPGVDQKLIATSLWADQQIKALEAQVAAQKVAAAAAAAAAATACHLPPITTDEPIRTDTAITYLGAVDPPPPATDTTKSILQSDQQV